MIIRTIFNRCKFLLLAMLLGACSSAVTVPCSSVSPTTAVMRVVVDWQYSGLVDAAAPSGLDVHRLSLRLFPLDGAPPFERYLEVDLYSGVVTIPVGKYAVVAMNEAIDDDFWRGTFNFSNVDSYDDLTVSLVEQSAGVVNPAKGLAVWSLPVLEITEDMANYSRGVMGVGDVPVVEQLSPYEAEQLAALQNIVMRPLTRNLQVGVTAENLGSIQQLTAHVSGLTRSMKVVSGEAQIDPTTHTMLLTNRDYDEPETRASATVPSAEDDGRAWNSQLTLGHADEATHPYELNLDVMMNDGTEFDDEEQTKGVDIASTIKATAPDQDYKVEHYIKVPVVSGESIGVDEWGDGGSYDL